MPGRLTASALGLAVVLAGTAASARPPSAASLARAIDAVLARPELRAATWGIEVRSLRTGRVLFSRNPEKNLRPASTLKLVATAAALDAFGPDATVRTTVETAGRLDARGRILGDVYLVGRGDPNLSARFDERPTAAFERLADALAAGGVRRIEGRLVGHEGLFTGERRAEGWTWDDLVWWYGAEVSALAFNDNCADLVVRAGERAGDPALVEWSPRTSYYRVVSTVTTSPAGAAPDLTVRRSLGANEITLTGSYPLGAPDWQGAVALEDPALYAATVFGEVLAGRGIVVTGGVATSSAPLVGTRVLAEHVSRTMAEMVTVVNKRSQNLHAEMLLRLLGARVKGEGSLQAGHEAAEEFLRRLRVAHESWDLQDGSGLSRIDELTAHGLVDLLVAMDRHPQAEAFRRSLPVAGVDGSLKDRLKGTTAEGRVLAKTGGLRHVNALAGYVTTRGGERLAFALLLNHHTGEGAIAAIDAIAAILAGS